MYIPRFAYSSDGDFYIKQGCSVAGTYMSFPDVFIYETAKRDFSLTGIWVEYKPLSSTSEVDTKVKKMNGENNTYGFIANTVAVNANNEATYKTMISRYNSNNTQINNPTNSNRTILKITNSSKPEPIKAKATFDKVDSKIIINIIYNENELKSIIDEHGEILSESQELTIKTDALGNGTYKYIIIDNLGNLKAIEVKVEGLKTYIIPNLNMLKKFRDQVNAGENFSGITVLQTADIAMNEGKYTIDETSGDITFSSDAEQWIPIGNAIRNFRGIYDGGNHTISGIYINSITDYRGLFGYCYDATIQNLSIDNSKITTTGKYVGGIVGYAYSRDSASKMNIINCKSSGNIRGANYTGGIVGYAYIYYNNVLSLNECYNIGKIEGGTNTGGVVGYIDVKSDIKGTVTLNNCHNDGQIKTTGVNLGGVVGYVSSRCDASLTNCYNSGKIESTLGYAGGVAGKIGDLFNKPNISITNCYNMGGIVAKNNVGGICGYVGTTKNATIKNCYNIGELVSKGDYLGGILGETGVYYSGDIMIENCYNTGNLKGIGKNYVGGICGDYDTNSDGYIRYCYNVGTLTGQKYVGGICGYYTTSRNSSGSNSLVSYCYNFASINGTTDVGSIVGCLYAGSSGYTFIKECYYVSGTSGTGIGGYSPNDSAQSSQHTYTASKTSIISKIVALSGYKKDSSNKNNGYPLLTWQ